MADVPLMNNPMTTAGDVIYGGASGAPTRLAKGTAAQVLKMNAGATAPEWGTASAGVGNLWTMANGGTSQTLTNNSDNTITFDTSEIDGGGSVIDTANERFVAPATGFYLCIMRWMWESTVPATTWTMQAAVGGTKTGTALRASGGSVPANGSVSTTSALSLTSGDFVTMIVNPGAVTGCTARGSASTNLRTSMTLVRIT